MEEQYGKDGGQMILNKVDLNPMFNMENVASGKALWIACYRVRDAVSHAILRLWIYQKFVMYKISSKP